MDSQVDRQKHTWLDNALGKQTNRQTDRQTDKQTNSQIDEQSDKHVRARMDVLPKRITLTFDPREIRAGLGSSSTNPGPGVAESNLRVFAECVFHCYPINVSNMNLDPDDLA